jgi:hypothetical protein
VLEFTRHQSPWGRRNASGPTGPGQPAWTGSIRFRLLPGTRRIFWLCPEETSFEQLGEKLKGESSRDHEALVMLRDGIWDSASGEGALRGSAFGKDFQQVHSVFPDGPDKWTSPLGKLFFTHVDERESRVSMGCRLGRDRAGPLCLLVGSGRPLQHDEHVHIAFRLGLPAGLGAKQNQALKARAVDLPEAPRGPPQGLPQLVGNR